MVIQNNQVLENSLTPKINLPEGWKEQQEEKPRKGNGDSEQSRVEKQS